MMLYVHACIMECHKIHLMYIKKVCLTKIKKGDNNEIHVNLRLEFDDISEECEKRRQMLGRTSARCFRMLGKMSTMCATSGSNAFIRMRLWIRSLRPRWRRSSTTSETPVKIKASPHKKSKSKLSSHKFWETRSLPDPIFKNHISPHLI